MDKSKLNIPEHLPERLAISLWIWNWATDVGKGEEFHDMEKRFQELVERGFNCIRIEAHWSWIFDIEGKKRGPVEISQIAEPGYSHYFPCYTTAGGIQVDVWDSLLKLFELAKKYNIYVALTSWEYQRHCSLGFLEDKSIRDEILSIPIPDRPMYLARQCHRLLDELKRFGFYNHIAYVELHNEINVHYFDERVNEHHSSNLMSRKVEEALAYLQNRHDNLIITDDHSVDRSPDGYFDIEVAQNTLSRHVKNAGALDHHIYAYGVYSRVFKELGFKESLISLENKQVFSDDNLKRNPKVRKILKPDAPSWEEYTSHLNKRVAEWWPLFYLYENMDVNEFDYLLFKYYSHYEDQMRELWKNYIYIYQEESRRRKVPLICDEGYFFCPPHHSNFETSSVGKKNFEFIVSLMLEADYWGIMISSYTLPDCGLWQRESQWLKKINSEILNH